VTTIPTIGFNVETVRHVDGILLAVVVCLKCIYFCHSSVRWNIKTSASQCGMSEVKIRWVQIVCLDIVIELGLTFPYEQIRPLWRHYFANTQARLFDNSMVATYLSAQLHKGRRHFPIGFTLHRTFLLLLLISLCGGTVRQGLIFVVDSNDRDRCVDTNLPGVRLAPAAAAWAQESLRC
jgi:hypothetical protein